MESLVIQGWGALKTRSIISPTGAHLILRKYLWDPFKIASKAGMNLGLRAANERRRYFVSSLEKYPMADWDYSNPFFYFALVIDMLFWKIYLISIGSHSYFRCVTAAKLHWCLANTNVLFNSAITFRNGKGDGILSSAPIPGYHPTQPLPVIHQ